VKEDLIEKVNREFWAFLQSQGFPKINDETIMAEADRISAMAPRKRMKARSWRYLDGGQHSDDVALVRILARSLGLEEGVEWDWALESDNYHFLIVFAGYPRSRKLIKMLDLYRDADLVRLQVLTRLKGKAVSDDKLQQIFREEWQRVSEEKQKQSQLLLKQLKAAFEGLEELEPE